MNLTRHHAVFCLCQVRCPRRRHLLPIPISALVKFEHQYMPFYTSELWRGSIVAGYGCDRTFLFHPWKKKAPVFDTLENVQPESAEAKMLTPSLTSVCFHLSTTVLIDKQVCRCHHKQGSYADFSETLIVGCQHNRVVKLKYLNSGATQHNFECHTGSYFRIN